MNKVHLFFCIPFKFLVTILFNIDPVSFGAHFPLICKEEKYTDDKRAFNCRVFPLADSNCWCQAAEDTWC